MVSRNLARNNSQLFIGQFIIHDPSGLYVLDPSTLTRAAVLRFPILKNVNTKSTTMSQYLQSMVSYRQIFALISRINEIHSSFVLSLLHEK